MSKKNIKNVISKIFNIFLMVGIVFPMVYFLYRFVIEYLEKSMIITSFSSSVFSAWMSVSGLFLKLLIISVFFLLIKILTVLPILFRRVSRYHRGTDVKEISLLSGIDDLKNLDVEKFIELYKENMYSAEKTAALLPVVLYAAATSNPDAEKILGFITGSDLTKSEDVDEIAHIKCQIDGKPYIALSYYTCTTPENEYRLLDNPITRIKDTGNFYNEDDEKTLYIACSGSGSYRPIRLKPLTPRMVKKSANEYIKDLSVDDTIWLFDEFSSTLVNVKTK